MTKVIGLTGGIASGKSTVSSYLSQKGLAIVDADRLVHELQARGGRLYQVLVNHFGSAILDETGEIIRPRLAELIFASPESLQESSSLQDRIIREELAEELKKRSQDNKVIFLDIPLLFEKGYEDWCDEVWLVVVDKEQQISRLMSRNAYSQEEAERRIVSQLSLEEKIKRADKLIDNNGSLEQTYAQLETYLADLAKG